MQNSHNQEQNTLTKQSLFEALMLLMHGKNFSDISISELASKAGVSRMAFYRHYAIIDDILIEHLNEIFTNYATALPKEHVTSYEMTKQYFRQFRQQQDFIENLLKSNLSYLILKQSGNFLEAFSKSFVCTIECSPEFEKYNQKFIAGGVFNVLMTWCMDGMQESDDKMATLICDRLGTHLEAIQVE